jgi:filamentous hemagglutinin family protein
MHRRARKLLLATTALVPFGLSAALANPLGGQVVGGSATIQGQGTPSVVINQSSSRAIINWNTFNIGTGEKTQFVQPSSSSVTLNRVTGGLGPSQIFGSLKANGQVFVVNPDGILIGAGATIDTAGFLATTHDIANADFMAGHYNFTVPGNPTASVVNQGTITAQSGGFAALVAPSVRNSGTITARLGRVALASGNGFSLDFYGDRLITLGVSETVATDVKDVATGQSLASLVGNTGKLKANGGTVELTAVGARRVVDSVINTSGVVEAHSIGTHNGRIVLGGPTADTKAAGAPVQSVKVAGKLSVSGERKNTTGGKIVIIGEDIVLTAANLDASGASGGGTVLIGGDTGGGHPSQLAMALPQARPESASVPTATTVSIDSASLIDASARATGDGGKVVVWSNVATSFAGGIAARGGAQAGDGGFVEVSGRRLGFSGAVNITGPSGKRGMLLLDPQDITIGNFGTWVITPAALQATLSTGDVLIYTDGSPSGTGDITFANDVLWGNASKLLIGAYRDVVINNGVTITNTGGGELDLGAGVTVPASGHWFGNGNGTIVFNGSGKVDFTNSTAHVTFAYNPIGGYASPTDFTSHVATNPGVTGQINSYMWVNNANDLQSINSNLSGSYALANNIDASATAGWNAGVGFLPIGDQSTPFTGRLIGFGGTQPFVGLGASIDRLTINSGPSTLDVGLFGVVGDGALVSNIGLTNVAISSQGFTGAVAGLNGGSIYQSYSTGTVLTTGGLAGGIVGANGLLGPFGNAIIAQSYSTASVTVPNGNAPGSSGGIAGQNGGLIIDSYATGAITGGTVISFGPGGITWSAGGLVGSNGGTVQQSYSTGLVIGLLNSRSGGLAGFHSSQASVSNSYWDTQTSGQTSDGTITAVPATVVQTAGLTTGQLQAGLQTGFSSAVWTIDPNINSGLPSLRWQQGNLIGAFAIFHAAAPGQTNTVDPAPVIPTSALALSFGELFGQTSIFMPIATTAAQSTAPILPATYSTDSSASFSNPFIWNPSTNSPTNQGTQTPQSSTGQNSVPTSTTTSPQALAVAEAVIDLSKATLETKYRYYTPENASSDQTFMKIVADLQLNYNFKVTDSTYKSDKVTTLSSGGDGSRGYIYPIGYDQNKDGWAECVSLVVALKGVTWETKNWVPSKVSVIEGGASPGDPIATFVNGKYSDAHAAIFVGYNRDGNGNILGWFMLDQNNVPHSEKPAGIRYYPVNGSVYAPEYYSFHS